MKTLQAVGNIAQKPTEGKWFEVNYQTINQQLFKKKRRNLKQEMARQMIQEAFTEVNKNPEKYAKPFKTMMPQKTWEYKTVAELIELAGELGDHIADWVEQSLEWAQRLSNGETWRAICNEVDNANWYRLVIWKNGRARNVGGSRYNYSKDSAIDIRGFSYFSISRLYNVVPLVVSYN